ncbi:unknown protein [Simkania negevensis Z]|uniref:Uncharacterized protein n=1 Tax=Simkania negevensis (strain ATCC VR-1471 / DSM 27360 / Z) TaxID=331113 RepID=F8L4D1_SIMNZ|nr:unknown protein [Simkania negevensis Z]
MLLAKKVAESKVVEYKELCSPVVINFNKSLFENTIKAYVRIFFKENVKLVSIISRFLSI